MDGGFLLPLVRWYGIQDGFQGYDVNGFFKDGQCICKVSTIGFHGLDKGNKGFGLVFQQVLWTVFSRDG